MSTYITPQQIIYQQSEQTLQKQKKDKTISIVIIIISIILIVTILIVLYFVFRPKTSTTPPNGGITGCLSNTDCSAAFPFCDTSTNTCQKCLDNIDCPGSAPICDTSSVNNTCVECTSSTHCIFPTNRCNLDDNTCVECTDDAHCPGTDICIQNNTCEPCAPVTTILSASMTGFSEFSISWTPVAGALEYFVIYRDNPQVNSSSWSLPGNQTTLISSTPDFGGSPCAICAPAIAIIVTRTACGFGDPTPNFTVSNPTCC